MNKTPTETRKVIRMPPAETTAMLQGTPNCSLATLDRDGYPHLVAMSFALDDDGNIGDESTRKFLQGFLDKFASLVVRLSPQDTHSAA